LSQTKDMNSVPLRDGRTWVLAEGGNQVQVFRCREA
jgi:hypothetical protein